LVIRDDDKENIIRERMEIYMQKTEPILEFYREGNVTKVIDLDPKRGVDDFPLVKSLLEKELAKY
jgi:adenylate kinase family enzyme